MNEWLKALKVGDRVALHAGWGGYGVSTIERLTATQIVLAGRQGRFRRVDGRPIGTVGFVKDSLHQLTPELSEKIELAMGIEWLKKTAPSLTLLQLRAMKAAYQDAA